MERHAPVPVQVTDELLRLAFHKITRPGWPRTFDAAMADHTFRTGLYGIARNLARARQQQHGPDLFDESLS